MGIYRGTAIALTGNRPCRDDVGYIPGEELFFSLYRPMISKDVQSSCRWLIEPYRTEPSNVP